MACLIVKSRALSHTNTAQETATSYPDVDEN